MAQPPPLPVPYERLVEQLHQSHILLVKLRECEQSPKTQVWIERLEAARSKMFAALRELP